MDKKSIIISLVISVGVLVVSLVLVILFAGSANKSQVESLKADITKKQQEIETLKNAKDENGFTPTNVVKAFLNEVKAGKDKTAKLYVSNELENADLKNTLKVGDIVTNISFGDALENISGDEATVTLTILGEDSEDEFTRSFDLSKIDGAWKIMEIIAE